MHIQWNHKDEWKPWASLDVLEGGWYFVRAIEYAIVNNISRSSADCIDMIAPWR
jgi:hypothetical protein